MKQSTAHNSEVRAEQAANKKHQVIKLGLDVHADRIVVVQILDHRAPQPAQRFSWAQFREWIKTQIALAAAVCIIVVQSLILFVGYKLLRIPMGRLIGILAAIMTQPGLLPFVEQRVGDDRPAAGYAQAYPMSLIAKIIVAQGPDSIDVRSMMRIPASGPMT